MIHLKHVKKPLISQWAELIIPETAKPLTYYDHLFFGKYPAITQNKFGKGAVTYFGTVPSFEIANRMMQHILEQEGLKTSDWNLPPSVKIKHGINSYRKTIHFYYNFSGEGQKFAYTYETGTDLLTNQTVSKGTEVTISHWGVIIVEEK